MGASGSSDSGATQPAPPPIPSHPAGTEPTAPNQPPATPSSSADHLDSVLKGVEKIRVLETEHEAKLALLAAKRKEVANLQKQYEEVRVCICWMLRRGPLHVPCNLCPSNSLHLPLESCFYTHHVFPSPSSSSSSSRWWRFLTRTRSKRCTSSRP